MADGGGQLNLGVGLVEDYVHLTGERGRDTEAQGASGGIARVRGQKVEVHARVASFWQDEHERLAYAAQFEVGRHWLEFVHRHHRLEEGEALVILGGSQFEARADGGHLGVHGHIVLGVQQADCIGAGHGVGRCRTTMSRRRAIVRRCRGSRRAFACYRRNRPRALYRVGPD